MLLSVSDARQRLLTAFAPLDTVHAPLTQATGRVLAEALVSRQDYPSFSNSSMDGFALRAEDVQRASTGNPVTLTVVADILAGRPSGVTLQPGETARIMTGAPLPVGADAVVPVEDTDFDLRDPGMAAPKRVKILRAVESGAYVRPKGGDICAGQKVISAGKKLHPQDIGMLAMLGFANVSVYRRPLVGVLSTGDELLPVGAPPEPGKIYESNAHTLSALIEGAGGKTLHLGIAQDRAEAVQERFDRAAEAGVDLIVSSAGVSVGAFDYVRSAVKANGALDFWRVNMRPGKPLAFGNYRGIPFIGLPGNPVSAFVGFEVFVRPALCTMLGIAGWQRVTWRGILLEDVTSDGRESYLRAVVTSEGGEPRVRLTGHQGSGNQFSLVQANAFIVVPAGVKFLPAGADVEIWPL